MKWKYVCIGASLLLGACQPMANQQANTAKPSTETVSKEKKENSSSKKVVEASFKTFDGKTVNLSDYKGKKVYIKVWASWCPTCLAGLPEVDALAADHAEDSVILSVVAPGVNREKKAQDFKEWFSIKSFK